MSGFRHKFIDIADITPVPITAADKRVFQATAKGKILIHIPNGDKGTSRVYLLDALYSASMGVTLVSISGIAKAGSTIIFQGYYCQIYNQIRNRIGEIREKGGLYHVFMLNSEEGANSVGTAEAISIDKLPHRLGHISHDRVKLLINKGLVVGVNLEAESEATVCESCEWAKSTRKTIVIKFIPTCGDRLLLKPWARNGTILASRMTTLDTPQFISFIPRTKLSIPIAPMKHGC